MALQLCNVAGWFGSVAETGLGDLDRAQKAKTPARCQRHRDQTAMISENYYMSGVIVRQEENGILLGSEQ